MILLNMLETLLSRNIENKKNLRFLDFVILLDWLTQGLIQRDFKENQNNIMIILDGSFPPETSRCFSEYVKSNKQKDNQKKNASFFVLRELCVCLRAKTGTIQRLQDGCCLKKLQEEVAEFDTNLTNLVENKSKKVSKAAKT